MQKDIISPWCLDKVLRGAAHGDVQVPAAKGSRGTKSVERKNAGGANGLSDWAQVVVVVVFFVLMLVVVTYRFVDILLSVLDEAVVMSSQWKLFIQGVGHRPGLVAIPGGRGAPRCRGARRRAILAEIPGGTPLEPM